MHSKDLFTPLEETISFYTRNDFMIINSLLVGDCDKLWKDAALAYSDNRGIIEEYESGVRKIETNYDIKWLNSLKKRLIYVLDEAAKDMIIKYAKSDIKNILDALQPSRTDLTLYRTSWVDKRYCAENSFPFSREYRSLEFGIGDIVEIKAISSFSMTPYLEDEDLGSPFYRYEIFIPKGTPLLELDQFITHNEDGEVLLPPMKFRLTDICASANENCKGILKIELINQL